MPTPQPDQIVDESFDVLAHVVEALKQSKDGVFFEVSLDGNRRSCEVMFVYNGVDYVLRAAPQVD